MKVLIIVNPFLINNPEIMTDIYPDINDVFTIKTQSIILPLINHAIFRNYLYIIAED